MTDAAWGSLATRCGVGVMVALAAVATVGCTGELSGADPGAMPRDGTGDAGLGGTGNVGGTGLADGGAGGNGATSNPSPGTGGRGGAGGGEPFEPPAGSIPMFVAQGHAGRTTVSCDDGHTWVADKSNDDSISCFEEGFDCDHDTGAGRGITWGDGWFYATFGWGTPGGVRRSEDGVDWETVLSGTTFGGVAYGNGRLVAADRPARYSDDQGVTWMNAGDSDLTEWNVRGAGFAPTQGGRFIMAASSGASEITVSPDGHTWSQPSSSPADCGEGIQTDGGIVYGNGTIVAMGSTAVACRSTDGGSTWTSSAIGGSITSQLVFSGGQFMVWGNGTLYRSTDGVTWTTTTLSPANLNLGPVAVSDSGTFVGVKGGWLVSYDKQAFYRSADGVTWETLPGSAFDGSHPIRFISFGYGKRSAACPD